MPQRSTALAAASFALVLASLLAPRSASAAPPDVLGFGPRSSALGMSGASFVSGYEGSWINPAGIALTEEQGIFFGANFARHWMRLDGEDSPLGDVQGSSIGFQLPLPFGGPLEDVLTLAAGFYTPTNTVLRTDVPFPDVPYFAVLARTQSVSVQLGLGIDLDRAVPGLRIGIGVNVLSQLIGDLDVTITDANVFLSTTETQVVTTFRPILGIIYEHGPWSAGLAYHAENKATIDIGIGLSSLPVTLPDLTIAGLAQYTPHIVVGELSYLHEGSLRFFANLTYRRFSAWPGSVGPSSALSLSPPAPGFSDTVSPRVGTEWIVPAGRTELAFRGAYVFEPTPAPPADNRNRRNPDGSLVDPNLFDDAIAPVRVLDSHRHILTGGAGVQVELPRGQHIHVDAFMQYFRVTPRTHNIPGPTPEGGTPPTENMRHSGNVVAAGGALGASW